MRKTHTRQSPTKIIHPAESSEQIRIVRWLERVGYFVCSIPNEGKRSFAMARKMRDMGMTAGMPDLLALGAGGGFFVEVKRMGGKLSPAQIDVHKRLQGIGWEVFTVYGFIDAIAKLTPRVQRLAADSKATIPRPAK